MSETITTNAYEGITTLGAAEAWPVGWDAADDMSAKYGRACMELTEALVTIVGMLPFESHYRDTFP